MSPRSTTGVGGAVDDTVVENVVGGADVLVTRGIAVVAGADVCGDVTALAARILALSQAAMATAAPMPSMPRKRRRPIRA